MGVEPSEPSGDRRGVIVLRLPSWPATVGISRAIDAITAELASRGLTMVVQQAAAGGSMRDLVDALSPALIVTDTTLGPADAELLRAERIPYMSLGIYDRDAPEVTLALWQVGHSQVSTLAKLGHRHLAYVAHSEEARRPFVMRRFGGAKAAASELGLATIALREPATDAESVAVDMRSWDPRVTGVLCYNDEVAAAVIAAARLAGRSVPDELSVIGADDLPPAQSTLPRITTVFTDIEVVAKDYADAMCAKIGLDAPPRPPGETLTKVVTRDSIARARRS